MDPGTKPRNCAFCLTKNATKLCGECHKRAYCSRECQLADWKPNGKGQGHKNWCHLECGEEDLDWEVVSIPEKGMGLVAKRMLPAKFRIIVDACRPKNHPAIKDLMPLDGTPEEKFNLNSLGCGNVFDEVLCLRICRANHKCDSNADHIYEETYKVKILFAERDIQAGEEICICYEPFYDISSNTSAQMARMILSSKWGIICPPDCFCYDQEMEKIITKSKELDLKINRLGSQGTRSGADAALSAVKQLLENYDMIIHSSWTNRKRTLYDGFQIAIMRKKTIKQAEDFIRKVYDIESCIMSPDSSTVLEIQRFTKDLRYHPNYLSLD